MKKLNIILAGVALCFLGACAFKNEDGATQPASTSVSELKIDPNSDSDGDGVKDGDEVAQGRNPFVAELPELKVRFLQSYQIEVTYHKTGSEKLETYVIDTKVKDTDPDYKFRVGSVFARSHALKTAASFGRFSSHNAGKIEERDYSWVSYPQLDSKFFNLKAFEFRSLLDSEIEIDNIKVTLTNQARLMESPFFKEIKNLKLNFYYLNHETENYDLLSATSVERHFQGGVYETFDVVIDHAPLSLLKDSFFKRGEFIISEVDDYEIPNLETTSKTLLGSIKAKSLPVLVETPLEEKLYYVAVQNTGVRLQNILKVIFDRNYKVENDQLTEVGQFKNNLGDYTHLKEVQDKDKLGKWFIMTNEFKEHYLDHAFTAQDRIVLAFITGTDLAEQKQEQFYSFNSNMSSQNSEMIMSLGNITPNSKVDIQLKPLKRSGTTVENQKIHWVTGGPCGKNCIPRDLVCDWDVNKFRSYNEPYFFPADLSFEGDKLSLILNGNEFSLLTLLKEKKIIIYKVDSNVHLVINDISKIKELKDFEESQLSLKVKAFVGSDFFGVKLVGMSGQYGGFGGCAFNTPQVAESHGTHISKDSLLFGEVVNWAVGAQQRGWTYPIQYLDSGPYYQDISLGVSSVIQNYYN